MNLLLGRIFLLALLVSYLMMAGTSAVCSAADTVTVRAEWVGLVQFEKKPKVFAKYSKGAETFKKNLQISEKRDDFPLDSVSCVYKDPPSAYDIYVDIGSGEKLVYQCSCGGELYRIGNFNVLVLNGSFREMGRQYGSLLGSTMQSFYAKAVEQYIIGRGHATYAQIRDASVKQYETFPAYITEMIEGMAETSGLSLEKQKILNNAAMLLIFPESFQGCSSLAAWGDYVSDGKLVMGRNWDLPPGYLADFQNFLSVIVYNPDSLNSVMEITYPGTFVFQTGMNSYGVSAHVQNGQMCDPNVHTDRAMSNHELFFFLLSEKSLDNYMTKLNSTLDNAGLLIPVADSTTAYDMQWPTYGCSKRSEKDYQGILATTNHYVDPPAAWPLITVPQDPVKNMYTYIRRDNLLTLANSDTYRGKINAEKMMEIFDTEIPGGATFPAENYPAKTYHQVVTVPADKTIWLKARGYSGWTKIELGHFFR